MHFFPDAPAPAPEPAALPELPAELRSRPVQASVAAPVAAASWAPSAAAIEVPSSGNWLYDLLFAEVHYMQMRDEAIAARDRDLVRVKVERGELPASALHDERLARPQAALPGSESSGGGGLFQTLFPERRHMALRRQALAERHRDLIRTKVERGELPQSALNELPGLDEALGEGPAEAGPRRGLWQLLFPERHQMALRRKAMFERHRDLVRTKVERGELPQSALDELVEPTDEQAAAAGGPRRSIIRRVLDELFAESRYMQERNQAIAAREADLRRHKEALARGEQPSSPGQCRPDPTNPQSRPARQPHRTARLPPHPPHVARTPCAARSTTPKLDNSTANNYRPP